MIPFAIKHGLWDPESGIPFHASHAYGTNALNKPRGVNGSYWPQYYHDRNLSDHPNGLDGAIPQPYYSLHRIWRGNMMLKPPANLNPFEPTQEYPLFLKPDKPITKADIFNVLKDHYQGTELDEYGSQDNYFPTIINPENGRYRLSPSWGRSRIIGCSMTISSWLTQSRKWLPDEVGGVLWAGLAASYSSPHLPFYSCNTRTPSAYQIGDAGFRSHYEEGSAYWLFENIGNIMNLFYQGTIDLVLPVWDSFEKRCYERQSFVESIALELYKENKNKVVEYLTDYSYGLALQALEDGRDMLSKIYTRLALLNNPQTKRGYEDPKFWKDENLFY